MITRLLCALMLLAALGRVAAARPAAKVSAQALAQAKAAFKEATAAYDAGRYDDALRAFQRAHELSRNPVLYFNLAACAEKLGQPRVAAAHLRAYLTEVPSADDAVKVRERLGALEERARHDDERRADEERRLEEEARRKKLEDERRAAQPDRKLTEVPTTHPARREPLGRRYAGGFALLGVTLAFGAVGAGLGASALVQFRDLEASCGMAGCGDRVDPVRRQALAADVFYGLTGAAAVATIVLFVVESRSARKDRVVADAGGLGGRF